MESVEIFQLRLGIFDREVFQGEELIERPGTVSQAGCTCYGSALAPPGGACQWPPDPVSLLVGYGIFIKKIDKKGLADRPKIFLKIFDQCANVHKIHKKL